MIIYFLISKNKIFNFCYETCKTCDRAGNPENHNCLTCDIEHRFRPDKEDCLKDNSYKY